MLATLSPDTLMRLIAPRSSMQGGGVPEGEQLPVEFKTLSPFELNDATKWVGAGVGDGSGIGRATGRKVSPQPTPASASSKTAAKRRLRPSARMPVGWR